MMTFAAADEAPAAPKDTHMRADIRIRDPFVYVDREQGTYYLYGTGSPLGKRGLDAYSSKDLEHWEGPFRVFQAPEGFWGEHSFWAPEMHRYRGKFYLFATFAQGENRRGTQICVGDSPRGPFTPLGPAAQTPAAWLSLDGTLFLDDAQNPWMVFCHEWLQVVNGEICAVRLSEDLSQPAGEPILLFRAKDTPLSATHTGTDKGGWITDGPFLYRHPCGALLMLWSTFGKDRKYLTLIARSASGKIEGPWSHDPEPLFKNDGGHGMIFRTLDNQLMLSIHSPNRRPEERALFLPLEETHDSLRIRP